MRELGEERRPLLAAQVLFGLWLLLAPSLWEFSDGADSTPGLVPIAPSDVTEPTRAMVARAEWNSILAGLLTLALAGSALLTGRRRQGRSAADARRQRSAAGRHRRRTAVSAGVRPPTAERGYQSPPADGRPARPRIPVNEGRRRRRGPSAWTR